MCGKKHAQWWCMINVIGDRTTGSYIWWPINIFFRCTQENLTYTQSTLTWEPQKVRHYIDMPGIIRFLTSYQCYSSFYQGYAWTPGVTKRNWWLKISWADHSYYVSTSHPPGILQPSFISHGNLQKGGYLCSFGSLFPCPSLRYLKRVDASEMLGAHVRLNKWKQRVSWKRCFLWE